MPWTPNDWAAFARAGNNALSPQYKRMPLQGGDVYLSPIVNKLPTYSEVDNPRIQVSQFTQGAVPGLPFYEQQLPTFRAKVKPWVNVPLSYQPPKRFSQPMLKQLARNVQAYGPNTALGYGVTLDSDSRIDAKEELELENNFMPQDTVSEENYERADEMTLSKHKGTNAFAGTDGIISDILGAAERAAKKAVDAVVPEEKRDDPTFFDNALKFAGSVASAFLAEREQREMRRQMEVATEAERVRLEAEIRNLQIMQRNKELAAQRVRFGVPELPEIPDLLQNPWVIGGAVVGGAALIYMLTKK